MPHITDIVMESLEQRPHPGEMAAKFRFVGGPLNGVGVKIKTAAGPTPEHTERNAWANLRQALADADKVADKRQRHV